MARAKKEVVAKVKPVVEVKVEPVVEVKVEPVVVAPRNVVGDTTTPLAAGPVINVATYTPNQPRFTIRCQKCRWAEVNNGTSPELKHLYEIKSGCLNCGKSRQFRCPRCGRPATMNRVKGV